MIILVVGLVTVVIAALIAVVFNVRFGRDLEPKGDTLSDLAPPSQSGSVRISDEDKTTTTEQ